MIVESKAPRKGNIFVGVEKLSLKVTCDEELAVLSDLMCVMNAGRSTRMAFYEHVRKVRESTSMVKQMPSAESRAQ